MIETETAQSIDDRAAKWIARIDRGPLDPTAQAELAEWLAGDERHRGAFFRAETAWLMLDRLSILGAGQRTDDNRLAALFDMSRRRVLGGGGMAAGCLAAAFAGFTLWRPKHELIETALGEIRRVPLSDGSLAAVNTATTLSVDLEPALRSLRLDRGEVWFEVAKDRKRPFVVAIGNARVRAVGTAFSVRRYDDRADVQVTEGVVEVWSIDRANDIARVSAGARTFISDAAGPARPIEASVDIDRTLAWRSGQLIFDGNSLGDAAAEFNRYNTVRLEIAGKDLALEQVVGRFRTNEPEAFARSVEVLLGVRAEMVNDRIILSHR